MCNLSWKLKVVKLFGKLVVCVMFVCCLLVNDCIESFCWIGCWGDWVLWVFVFLKCVVFLFVIEFVM